jgi:hypothetical protein
MLDRTGFAVIDVELNDINGGSFSVTATKNSAGHSKYTAVVQRLINQEQKLCLSDLAIYNQFRDRVFKHREKLQQFLRNARAGGEKILGYGASTKGNVILQFCGITTDDLPCIADVNSDKFGAFTPGTKIPIVSEEEARSQNPHGFLVFPWHFRDSIIDRETNFLAKGGKLIFPLPSIEVIGN